MEKEEIKVIEKLNLDYLNSLSSKEYRLGRDLFKVIDNLKKGKLLSSFISKNKRKKISKYNIHGELDNDYNLVFEDTNKPKIAVYTCITDNYDDIYSPLLKPDNIDYYLFSDNIKESNIGYFNILSIPENIKEYDRVLQNRYIKMHPHELFTDYDYSIYIDGNVMVVSDLTDLVCSINESGLSLHNHQFRNSISNEIEVCKLLNKGNYDKLKSQVKRYIDEGYLDTFGLYECNVILTDLNNEKSIKILNDWWEEYLKSESYRDQISFPYVVWKNNLKYNDIGCLGKNVYKNPKFRIINHK